MSTNGPEGTGLYLRADMEGAEIQPIGGGRAAVFTVRAPGKEAPNEDAAALIATGADSCILVVADGMGGGRGGEQASGLAIESLRDSVGEKLAANGEPSDNDLRNAILNGIETANRKITELGIGAATTLAAVEVRGRTVRPYHVGDSMILLVGNRGRVKLQTVSHSPVGYGVEAGLIDEREAMHHEERHVVSNMIGTAEMRIEVGPPLEMAKHDTLLIASDGLFDNLHLEEIVERVRKGPLKKGVARLVADGRRRMERWNATPGGETPTARTRPSKPDDLTFIAFRLEGPR